MVMTSLHERQGQNVSVSLDGVLQISRINTFEANELTKASLGQPQYQRPWKVFYENYL